MFARGTFNYHFCHSTSKQYHLQGQRQRGKQHQLSLANNGDHAINSSGFKSDVESETV